MLPGVDHQITSVKNASMNTQEAIYSRRAIKHYDPDHRFTEEEIRTLFKAAIQSPTSFNIQHWRFVLVRDPELRARIRAVGNDQAQMTDASLLVIMTADINAWDEEPERYWRNAPTEVGKAVSGLIRPFYSGREQLQRDEAMRSIGMAMQTLMLMARDMGYDSCPMIGFDLEAVSELINLPEGHCIGPMVSIGKRTQDAWPKPGQLPLEEVLIENTFPSRS